MDGNVRRASWRRRARLTATPERSARDLPRSSRRLDARSRSAPGLDADANLRNASTTAPSAPLARDLTAHTRVADRRAAVPGITAMTRALGLYPVTGLRRRGRAHVRAEARDAFAQPAGPPRGTILAYRRPAIRSRRSSATVASMVDAEPLPGPARRGTRRRAPRRLRARLTRSTPRRTTIGPAGRSGATTANPDVVASTRLA
jgi:hypothetical protein